MKTLHMIGILMVALAALGLANEAAPPIQPEAIQARISEYLDDELGDRFLSAKKAKYIAKRDFYTIEVTYLDGDGRKKKIIYNLFRSDDDEDKARKCYVFPFSRRMYYDNVDAHADQAHLKIDESINK